jgi:tRNA (cytosine38-C5)-methyltransferase
MRCHLCQKTSTTRQILLSTLQSLGYMTVELLITPLQFGIPNSRLRYYLLAKRTLSPFPHIPIEVGIPDHVWRHIPGHTPWIDPRSAPSHSGNIQVEASTSMGRALQIKEYLEEDDSAGVPHPNAIPDKVLEKWGRLFDIVLPSSYRTCCFTRGL